MPDVSSRDGVWCVSACEYTVQSPSVNEGSDKGRVSDRGQNRWTSHQMVQVHILLLSPQ